MADHDDEADECVELKWMLADPDPPVTEPGHGALFEWYRLNGFEL